MANMNRSLFAFSINKYDLLFINHSIISAIDWHHKTIHSDQDHIDLTIINIYHRDQLHNINGL